eukprot:1350896-Rhodomonas_salina.1
MVSAPGCFCVLLELLWGKLAGSAQRRKTADKAQTKQDKTLRAHPQGARYDNLGPDDTTIHAINKITAKIIKGDVYHAPPPPFFPLFGATAIAKEGNGGGGEIGAYADVNQEHYY